MKPAGTDFSLHLGMMWLPTEMSKKKKENDIKKKKNPLCVSLQRKFQVYFSLKEKQIFTDY